MPKWWDSNRDASLILSDDIDSFFSCQVLEYIKWWDIGYFYSFSALGSTDDALKNKIGVDIALQSGKCFDNHVVKANANDPVNIRSINFNVADGINRSNYFTKYCGSTLLMLWALYDLPLPESEEGKLILLCIDSTYKGYYSPYSNDNKANKHYLVDVMGFSELYEVLERHKQTDFAIINHKYKLSEKIKLIDGKLHTNINLAGLREVFDFPFLLPEKEFKVINHFTTNGSKITSNTSLPNKDIFSLALTRRDYVNYSKVNKLMEVS